MKLDRKQLSSGEKESDYDLMPAPIRSISVIGALWPLCNRCRHIAQAHNAAGPECCSEMVIRQCEHCGTNGVKLRCSCTEYDGPTWEQFKADYLTPEEIAYYKWGPKNDGLDEYRTRLSESK